MNQMLFWTIVVGPITSFIISSLLPSSLSAATLRVSCFLSRRPLGLAGGYLISRGSNAAIYQKPYTLSSTHPSPASFVALIIFSGYGSRAREPCSGVS